MKAVSVPVLAGSTGVSPFLPKYMSRHRGPVPVSLNTFVAAIAGYFLRSPHLGEEALRSAFAVSCGAREKQIIVEPFTLRWMVDHESVCGKAVLGVVAACLRKK